MKNYALLMNVLKRWPVDRDRSTRDFGHHLRQIAKNGFPNGNIFQGNEAENTKMLNSLLRLSENKYGTRYPFSKTVAASGFTREEIKQRLTDDFIDENMRRGS